MEQIKRSVPNEVQKCESPLTRNPWIRGTPMKQNDVCLKRPTFQNTVCMPFSALPSHITPPSKLRRFITKNPFEPDLINRLHLSTISPTVFSKVPSPMRQSPEFTWSIDELAIMQPVRIEESPMQQVHSPDPELEVKAQAAIDRFFKQNQIIPSPWDTRQKGNKPFTCMNTPKSSNDRSSPDELSKTTKDAWSQTVLSLPLDLPQNVEEVLKPFLTFTQEQNTDDDDVNLSNNSLRRKLFFCHDECTDNENESFISLSPVKMNESMVLSCSPPQSGMFVHGTPLKFQRLLQAKRQSNGSSVISENLSPSNMSPIHNENDRLFERIEFCSRSASRLSFSMDMSIDGIERKNKNFINGYHSLDASDKENDVKHTEDNDKLINMNNDKADACESVNTEELQKCINSISNIESSNVTIFYDKEHSNEINLKTTEITNFVHERHKRSNIISGAFDQQSISNSIQDTGYQTYSMNSSTMHTIDSYNTSNQKTYLNEKIMTPKDNTQLSWRENIRNVFSSTPSKHDKESGN
ncbi:hypothetical protein P5V15_011032 [Pogonomyrmex californicus]